MLILYDRRRFRFIKNILSMKVYKADAFDHSFKIELHKIKKCYCIIKINYKIKDLRILTWINPQIECSKQ